MTCLRNVKRTAFKIFLTAINPLSTIRKRVYCVEKRHVRDLTFRERKLIRKRLFAVN